FLYKTITKRSVDKLTLVGLIRKEVHWLCLCSTGVSHLTSKALLVGIIIDCLTKHRIPNATSKDILPF
ncbi:hypothetical protein LINPERPRIM_LOCUS27541, partial [Linum perenne]